MQQLELDLALPLDEGFSPRVASLAGGFVAIGTFDGVHRGHQKIIGTMAAQARAAGVPGAVLTFRPHPLGVIDPAVAPREITTFEDRLRLMGELGVDAVLTVRFTPAFAAISAQSFVTEILAEALRVAGVFIGFNFRFGAGGRGGVDLLRTLGTNHGFMVHAFKPICVGGELVSSSLIREKLSAGEVSTAGTLLGRPPFVRGKVVHGDGRGRALGFPTANLSVAENVLLPLGGVYAGRVFLGGEPLPAVMNLGTRPTFGPGGQSFEVHLLGFSGDLYGAEILVEFIDRLRTERRFSSRDELVEQIQLDVAAARAILARRAAPAREVGISAGNPGAAGGS